MKSSGLALISRRIILSEYFLFSPPSSLNGAILIKNGKIEEILPLEALDLSLICESYEIEDLSNLCVFPGLVDINVSLNCDGISNVSKQALSGGVTTLATSDPLHGDFFTDISRIKVLHDDNIDECLTLNDPQVFAFKSFLVPQGPTSQILTKLDSVFNSFTQGLIIIHPELAEKNKLMQATPFRQIEPEKRTFLKIIIEDENIMASQFKLESEDEEIEEGSESCSEETPEIKVNDFSDDKIENAKEKIVSHFENMTLTVPEKEKKRISLPNLLNPVAPTVKSPRHHSLQPFLHSRPIPIQDVPFIAKGFDLQQAYHNHIVNFPPEWETSAIASVLSKSPSCRVHFCNVCSESALLLVKNYKSSGNITCETSLPYLYFNENDVKPGDTRYKLNPPIRDYANNKALWGFLKNNEIIDCVTSYHQPAMPHLKFMGDFQRALNGVISIGFVLQALWTKLRTQISVASEGYFLGLLSVLLSMNPAKILGISQKGGIFKGKNADLIVWDPDSKQIIKGTWDRFPEMSPLKGEIITGKIERVYLNGEVVFNGENFVARGKILSK